SVLAAASWPCLICAVVAMSATAGDDKPLGKADSECAQDIPDGHKARPLTAREGKNRAARRRNGPGPARRSRCGCNLAEVGEIRRACLEGAAPAGHGKIGRPDEQAIDCRKLRDGGDIAQRAGCFDHGKAGGAAVLRGKESASDTRI